MVNFKHGTPYYIVAEYLSMQKSPLADFYYKFPNLEFQEQRISCGAFGYGIIITSKNELVEFNSGLKITSPNSIVPTQICSGTYGCLIVDNQGKLIKYDKDGFNVMYQSDIIQASARAYHFLLITSENVVISLGYNKYNCCNIPKDLKAIQVSAGVDYSLAITPEGKVIAWGDNSLGQCNVPEDLIAVQVNAGAYHSLAITPEGKVVAWGDNTEDQCNVPEKLYATQINVGFFDAVAIDAEDNFYTFGWKNKNTWAFPEELNV